LIDHNNIYRLIDYNKIYRLIDYKTIYRLIDRNLKINLYNSLSNAINSLFQHFYTL